MEPSAGVMAYDINSPQWADGAAVKHWMAIPDGVAVDVSPAQAWSYPNGAVLVQQLEWTNKPGRRPTRLETRILTKNRNDWAGYTYLWRKDQSDADLVSADGDDIALSERIPGDSGPAWHVPSRAECMMCHSRAANFVLGATLLQANHRLPDGRTGLESLESGGILHFDVAAYESWRHGHDHQKADFATPSSSKPSILLPRASANLLTQPDPYDASAPLEARVRSYLTANCAQCHIMSGGGNSAMEFDFFRRLEDFKMVNEAPQHWNFDIEGAKIVAPGHPEKSILYKRLSQKEQGGMPPIALNRVDPAAADLIRDWILSLKRQ